MGSFNTTCFASMQTIATGDECFIFPIVMQSGYEPVEISIGEKEFAPYGFTSSICYANAFWSAAGRLISAKYDDYGRFEVDNNERNKFILAEIFNRANFFKTEQGANRCHDVPFDPELLDKEDPFKALDYLWEPMHEHRVFVRNYKGQPAQFQFAVISKAAADYLFNMVNSDKDWSDRPLKVEDKINQMENDYKSDEELFFRFMFREYFERGEGYNSCASWYVRELLNEQKDKENFTERTKEILSDLFYEKYVFSGFEWFNIKILPIIYASQDYRNEIGKGYAKFVNTVSKQICKIRNEHD